MSAGRAPGWLRTGQTVRLLVWLGLAAALLPFAYALGFCFPRGDDFDEVTRAMFLGDVPGGLYELGREWLTWSGRYSYHFLAVFLGKAGEMRWAYGLICGAILTLYGVALSALAREAGVRPRDAAPLGLFGVLALCACHQNLWAFYMLTDALTMGLQPVAALLFFWSLCRLWTRVDADAAVALTATRRARRAAIALGVFAVGIFEHSALGVLLGAGIACALAVARDLRAGLSPRAMLRGRGRLRAMLPVALWCLGAALFSFLAPGNQYRRATRGIDAETQARQLGLVWTDWGDAVSAFVHSFWPVVIAVLVLLILLLRERRPGVPDGPETPARAGLSRGERLLLAALAVLGYGVYSLGLTVLHALSDVPMHAAGKLPAGLAQYAGFALGFALYALAGVLYPGPDAGGTRRGRVAAALLLGLGLTPLLCLSDNWRQTTLNAVNGSMVLLAQAQETRDAWLRGEGRRSAADPRPRFGLLGELYRPGVRSRRLDPSLPLVLVQRQQEAVFPVWRGTLPAKPEQWPNLWVAWMYGVGGVASAAPDPAPAVAQVLDAPEAGTEGADNGPDDLTRAVQAAPGPLTVPAALRRLGVKGAWRVTASGGPNPTFADVWLVVACREPLPERIAIVRPNPLDWRRLLPLGAQAWLLDRLIRQNSRDVQGVEDDRVAENTVDTTDTAAFPDFFDRCAATVLSFDTAAQSVPTPSGFFYAFPLGLAGNEWPAALIVRLNGATPWAMLRPASETRQRPEPPAQNDSAHVRF